MNQKRRVPGVTIRKLSVFVESTIVASPELVPTSVLSSSWSDWIGFNVTINDISVIYVTIHRCAGGRRRSHSNDLLVSMLETFKSDRTYLVQSISLLLTRVIWELQHKFHHKSSQFWLWPWHWQINWHWLWMKLYNAAFHFAFLTTFL